MWVALVLSALAAAEAHEGHHEPPSAKRNLEVENPVVIVSFDGFRWDYVQRLRNLTKDSNFDKLIARGFWAPQGITNAYSTVTFPNHYTLATGLYEESHGIIGNHIYDPGRNRTYNMLVEKEASAFIYKGEPIWQTFAREKDATKVACYMWVGCDTPIGGIPPIANQIPYEKQDNCGIVMDQGLKWLQDGFKLSLLYYHEPDATGHKFGPDSPELDAELLRLNACVGQLLDSVAGLSPQPNLILTADHGMTTLRKLLIIPPKPTLFRVLLEHASHALLLPVAGQEEAAFQYLKGFEPKVAIFRREDIPERLHYKRNKRILGILVMAKLGVSLSLHSDATFGGGGSHGYDTAYADMRPYLAGLGPALRSGGVEVGPEFHSVDVYLLLCNLLGLVGAPNNGTQALVDGLLSPHGILHSPHATQLDGLNESTLIVAGLSVAVVVWSLGAVLLHRASRRRRRNPPPCLYQPLTAQRESTDEEPFLS